jgi:hypothetical protein
MNPDTFASAILLPNLAEVELQLGIPFSWEAARFLQAVALQESDCAWRYQRSRITKAGPARGWFEFERAGGVRGVMRHPRTASKAQTWAALCFVRWEEHAIWRALEGHDKLAVGFARLLLWSDPYPMPTSPAEAWNCYCHRLWRPGKPRPNDWKANWTAAGLAINKLRITAAEHKQQDAAA